MKFIFMMSKLQFSASLLLSEIILISWFAKQETFLIIINVKNNVDNQSWFLPYFLVETVKHTIQK